MTKPKGLGKGLGALMGDVSLQSQEGGSVTLPIAQVEPGLNQPRKRFEPEALADLADSIREHGIIQPLTVRRLSSGYYQIIAGERRWRAAKQAGLTEVPALIIEADDRKVMELGLIENENELGKYYMHGVSHHLGIDVHDVTVDGVKLTPGSVITNEPGLYIDEWAIGIRIEDDLLITEDGCKVLSEAIIKEPDEIEAFMAR